MKNQSRRDWIRTTALANLGMLLSTSLYTCASEGKKRVKTILIVSGWQDVNIGDIAHTPGLLEIFETFLPDVEIILWKKSRGEKVKTLLNQNYPKVKIIYGEVNEQFEVDNEEVVAAFNKADVMVHGSGPFIVGKTNLEAWVKYTNKPFGIFGTTIQYVNDDLAALLKKAAFIYTRETKSIQVLKENGIQGKHVAFAPDATFFLGIHNEVEASDFLKENELEEKKFICVIPRLRYTPYHKIRKVDWTSEKIERVERVNEEKKEEDHAKMRAAIIAWVRETGNKVLVCPEMTYQVDIMDELLIDPLPKDVKPLVTKRDYWMPDTAASVYAKAYAVLSFECHSPIIAAANGTPMFYLRQPEDTIKGHMYYDLGFEDWVFEIEQTTAEQITQTLRVIWSDYEAAKNKLASAMDKVHKIYDTSTAVIKDILQQ